MIKRPKNTDTEQDILDMQKDFLSKTSMNSADLQPAAKVIRLSKDQNQSTKKSNIDDHTFTETASKSKDQSAGIENESIIIGDIIEKKYDNAYNSSEMQVDYDDDMDVSKLGFPIVTTLDVETVKPSKKSLFALSKIKKDKENKQQLISSDIQMTESSFPVNSELPQQSFILDKSKVSEEIHNENIQTLLKLPKDKILMEQKELLENLDPSIIKFIQNKRKVKQTGNEGTECKQVDKFIPEQPITNLNDLQKNIPNLDLFLDKNLQKYVNFNIIEPEKLEWIKDIEKNAISLKPGEFYEARFDWKGFLLPYMNSSDNTIGAVTSMDDRELYFHGDDAHRPGYTLQELFRLARSNVMQQRLSSIGAINGLLEIYNQGFYDSVLDLPISKIFFLLRFTLDENAPALLEITTRALAKLFYNESDETLLDFIFDCTRDCNEPTLDLAEKQEQQPHQDNTDLSDKFKTLNLSNQMHSNLFRNTFDDEEMESDKLNDFHLAEIDLIECLLRTNILQRINYILFTVKPDDSTVVNCIKVLIRLVRTNRSICKSICQSDLISDLLIHYLPQLTLEHVTNERNSSKHYNNPQMYVLKLLRIICSYGQDCKDFLIKKHDLLDRINSFISYRGDITVELISVQIEVFRLLRVIIYITHQMEYYQIILSNILYLLEWHYRFLKFEATAPSIFRQHAATIISIIGIADYNIFSKPSLILLALCFSKWFRLASEKNCTLEFSQSVLLSTCLNTCCNLDQGYFEEFRIIYLKDFLAEPIYYLTESLCGNSLLLSTKCSRTTKLKSLSTLNSIILENQSPKFIISSTYLWYLLNSIVEYILFVSTSTVSSSAADGLIQNFFNKNIQNHLIEISNKINNSIKMNWFARIELKYLINLLKLYKSSSSQLLSFKIQNISHNVICSLPECNISDIYYLLSDYISNIFQSGDDNSEVESTIKLYNSFCLPPKKVFIQTTLMIDNFHKPVLSNDWSYMPLITLLSNVCDIKVRPVIIDIPERTLISRTLSFVLIESINSLTDAISPTEQLMYLMMVYFGKNNSFLEQSIKSLVAEYINVFFKLNTSAQFDFEAEYEDKSKFENLYILFLNQFQATSYGDDLFGVLVLVPLQQKYDIKWRNIIWSEHVDSLRFITCTDEQLIGSIDDYLYPIETDVQLIKLYYQAIHSNSLIKGSIPYRIAEHHYQQFKQRKSNKTNEFDTKIQ